MVNDGSCTSVYRLWAGDVRKAPNAIPKPWWWIGSNCFRTDRRAIRTQCIHNPIWSGLMSSKGVAGRYDRLPNQCVPLHEECPEALRYWMWFLNVRLVSKIRPRNFASLTTFIGVFPRRMLGSGKKTYCWWKWIQTVLEVENLKQFSDTHFWMLFTHRQLHSSLHSV